MAQVLKIGKVEIELKPGDYVQKTPTYYMFCSGDDRILYYSKHSVRGIGKQGMTTIELTKRAEKQLGIHKLKNSDWKTIPLMDIYLLRWYITQNWLNLQRNKGRNSRNGFKLWNGYMMFQGKQIAINVAAKSLKAAAKLMSLYSTKGTNDNVISSNSIRPYFNDGWGNSMDNVIPNNPGIYDNKGKKLYPSVL